MGDTEAIAGRNLDPICNILIAGVRLSYFPDAEVVVTTALKSISEQTPLAQHNLRSLEVKQTLHHHRSHLSLANPMATARSQINRNQALNMRLRFHRLNRPRSRRP
jgi:hypothetical protein